MSWRKLQEYFDRRGKEGHSDVASDPGLKERTSKFDKWKRSSPSNRPNGLGGIGTTTGCCPSDRQSGNTTTKSCPPGRQSQSCFDKTPMEHIITHNSEAFMEMKVNPSDVVDAGQPYFIDRRSKSFDKPTIIQPVVDHVSRVLEKIRADMLYIAGWEEPENSAPNIGQLRACILEMWKGIELRAQRPAEFLYMWDRVEVYRRVIHEIRLSITANEMTEDMANGFRRRLSDLVPANVQASHDGVPRPLQAPSTNFFKDIENAVIYDGQFVHQTVVTEGSAQSETYLKEIRNCTYLWTVIGIVFLF